MRFRPPAGQSIETIITGSEEEMGKLVVSEFVTLDGVIDDPGGADRFDRGGWALSCSAPAKTLFGDSSKPRLFTVVASKPAGATVLLTLTSSAP